VQIARVEIQKIDPPHDITEAMSRQMKAEREKRAVILTAEAVRQKDITEAEGYKQRKITEAQGEAQAIERVAEATRLKYIKEAEGRAQAITDVFNSIRKAEPTPELLSYMYLQMMEKMADGKATKLVIPYEAAAFLGASQMFVEAMSTGKGSNLGGLGEMMSTLRTRSSKLKKGSRKEQQTADIIESIIDFVEGKFVTEYRETT
jgi:regulator of protease activity HflC (stomatin/prohibitin superfamily)